MSYVTVRDPSVLWDSVLVPGLSPRSTGVPGLSPRSAGVLGLSPRSAGAVSGSPLDFLPGALPMSREGQWTARLLDLALA